jgi:HSP20 family protein
MATTLERRRFFPDFAELQERFDRMLEDVAPAPRGAWRAPIDVIKEADKIVVRVEMPGIEPDDVKITVEDDILTVSGEHDESKETKDENFIRRERRYGSFSRSLALPAAVDAGQIAATSKNGVLEVTVPLPKEKEKKPVEIKAKTG